MSLHKFAEQVAANGRGDDSLLVHMTPDEVRKLQQFAEANGTTLTINPHTGLPEAGLLSDFFKMVAPVALGAFLGPAGMGITFGGLSSAASAGLLTGGITSLATGSLSRGLMAGLGAYGGAGLGEGLMNAGTGAGLSEALAGSATGTGPQVFGDVAAAQGSSGQAFNEFLKSGANPATMSGAEAASAGLKAAAADPMAFAKQNFGNIAAAAAPIMAGAMVPTTTKMPADTSPAYIRQKLYDPYTQTYKSLAPVKASEWGSRSFSDAYTNPQTGEMATLQPRAPSGLAGGGIVALANGGVAHFDGGGITDAQIVEYFKSGPKSDEQIARDMDTYKVTAADIARATGTQDRLSEYENRYAKADTKNDIYDYFAKADTQSLLKSGNDKAIADTLQANDWKLADVAAATGTQNLLGDYGTRYVNAVSDRSTDANEFLARANDVGLTGADLATALQNSGQSAAAQYALTHNLADTGGITGTNFYSNLGYKTGALPGDQGGLEGLYANINYSASGLQSLIDSGKMTVAQAQDAALAEMQRSGTSLADIKAATGKSFGDLFKPKTIVETKTKIDTVKGGTGTDTITGGTGNDVITTPVVTPPPFTSVVPTGFYGNATNPGDITTNKDGTVTVHPNIPYRPYGGFSGMGEVRNAYTKGGGSLGYTAKAPKTIEEFNQLYNKQTGDSLAAYDYLMGKGSGKYPVQSVAASTGIQRPYWSEGMRYKPKFLSYDEAGNTVSSSTNPNAPKSGDAKVADLTKAKTIEVVDSSGETTQTYTAVLQEDGTYLAGNGKRYDVTGKELAAGGGMMGYAAGGITGDGNLNLHIPLDFGGGFGGGNAGAGLGSIGVTGSTGGFSSQNNTASGGFGATNPYNTTTAKDMMGGSRGPAIPFGQVMSQLGNGTPAGLDDSDMGAIGLLTQQQNAAARASYANANPASMSDLAKRLGYANGGMAGYAVGGGLGSLGSYSDGGRLLKGPGDGVSDSIPATIGAKQQPARLADGEFVIPARIVSELGNGSTEAGAKKLYAMMDRVQKARSKTTGKNKVAANSRADKYLPA